MKTFVTLILILLPFIAAANKDTTYFFGANGKITGISDSRIEKKVTYLPGHKIEVVTSEKRDGKISRLYTEKYKTVNDSVFRVKAKGGIISESVTRRFSRQPGGIWKFTDYAGKMVIRSGYTSSKIPLLFEGSLTEYYRSGRKKSISEFRNNELVSNENWLENGEEYISNIFYSADKEPLFPQGMGYLHQHILKTFKESKLDISNISGNIQVGFVVLETGQIDGIRIIKGIGNQLDSLAILAFKTLLGTWEPAETGNHKVRYFQVFPINFISSKTEFRNVEFNGGVLSWDVN